jgi:hypothetical protein
VTCGSPGGQPDLGRPRRPPAQRDGQPRPCSRRRWAPPPAVAAGPGRSAAAWRQRPTRRERPDLAEKRPDRGGSGRGLPGHRAMAAWRPGSGGPAAGARDPAVRAPGRACRHGRPPRSAAQEPSCGLPRWSGRNRFLGGGRPPLSRRRPRAAALLLPPPLVPPLRSGVPPAPAVVVASAAVSAAVVVTPAVGGTVLWLMGRPVTGLPPCCRAARWTP